MSSAKLYTSKFSTAWCPYPCDSTRLSCYFSLCACGVDQAVCRGRQCVPYHTAIFLNFFPLWPVILTQGWTEVVSKAGSFMTGEKGHVYWRRPPSAFCLLCHSEMSDQSSSAPNTYRKSVLTMLFNLKLNKSNFSLLLLFDNVVLFFF